MLCNSNAAAPTNTDAALAEHHNQHPKVDVPGPAGPPLHQLMSKPDPSAYRVVTTPVVRRLPHTTPIYSVRCVFAFMQVKNLSS